jgi:hypothetical protein
MTDDKKGCKVEGCKNETSDLYWNDFRGTWCEPHITAQRIIDGNNRRKWAREDRQAKVLRVLFSIPLGVLALWGFVALIKFFWMHS